MLRSEDGWWNDFVWALSQYRDKGCTRRQRTFITFVLYEACRVRDLRRNVVEYEDQAKRAFIRRKHMVKRTRHVIEYLIRDTKWKHFIRQQRLTNEAWFQHAKKGA